MSTTQSFITVPQSYVGLLYEEGVFVKQLAPGKYQLRRWYWPFAKKREVWRVDMRERSLTLKGQEILTADKVAI